MPNSKQKASFLRESKKRKKKKDTIYVESMTKVTRHNLVFRCWRQESKIAFNFQKNLSDVQRVVLNEMTTKYKPGITHCSDIAKALLKLDRMNAVEVLDSLNGHGVVLYKNWP